MAAAEAPLQARGGRADLCRAPRRLGGHGPPRLRRGGIQRAPHLAVRPDELAELIGRGGRSAHPAAQAPRSTATCCRSTIRSGSPRSWRCSTACRTGASFPDLPAAFRASTTSTTSRWPTRAPASRRPGRSSAARGRKRSSRYEGRFWSYRDVAIWPRPVQTPHPPVWVPVTGSKETIEWAGRHDIPITPGLAPIRGSARGHHPLLRALPRPARSSAHAGSPDHPGDRVRGGQQGAGGARSRTLRPLLQPDALQPRQHHGVLAPARRRLSELGVVRLRETREHACRVGRARALSRHDDGRRRARGRAVALGHRRTRSSRRSSRRPTTPAPRTVLVNMNRGAMPQEMFLEQVHRFGNKVLPALRSHTVTAR